VPRLGLASVEVSNASVSRLNVLVLASTQGLGLGLDLGSKRLSLVGKHLSITAYIKLCLNMPLRFSLSSKLPPLLFRTTSVLGMMWMCDVASVLMPQSRGHLRVGMPRPRLKLRRLWSRLGLNCQHLSLGLEGLCLASVSTKKAYVHP